MADDAVDTVRAYYAAVREADPLHPFFADGEDVVKVGIGERLVGADAIEAGLREQTRTTTDWVIESRDLRVTARDRHAWFDDDVFMAWTDTERSIRFEFESRWSGTLERTDGAWRFVGMHVSTPGET